jgi:15-cis-phytoene synthase
MNNSAKAVMQKHGKTFALAARLLTAESRHAATQLYAFARTIDDMIDLQAEKPSLADLQVLLQRSQTQTVLQQFAISDQAMHAFLQSQMQDATPCQLQTEQALIDYAYGVAGSIGAMMRPILGAPRTAETYAISLGIAMQMTNIARDVVEDAARERIYMPATFFAEKLAPAQLIQPDDTQKQQIFAAIEKLLLLADNYYDFAKKGYADIPLRNRLSIITAGKMYQAIGKQILENGESQYWQGRVSLGLAAKLKIAGKAIMDEFFAKKQLASSFDLQADLQATIKQAIASYAAK